MPSTLVTLAQMEDVNEPMVLNNLRLRARADEYFTNIGPILVSVNPFKWQHRPLPKQTPSARGK